MAIGDFYPVDRIGITARKYQTKAGQTAIKAGEWVVQDTGGDSEYVVGAADGASNTSTWVGVAASADTVTSSADGVVYVFDDPSIVFEGKPTTASNLASTLINTQVTLDINSGTQTVDENDTSNGTLRIVGVDADRDTIQVQMAADDHISKG